MSTIGLWSRVSHEGRMSPLKNAYNNLQEHLKDMEVSTDELILVGKPQGQCSLCFNRSIR